MIILPSALFLNPANPHYADNPPSNKLVVFTQHTP
jgi:hypothetical protein